MGDERRSCPACGSSNRVEALWCAMCHQRFVDAVPPPPPPVLAPSAEPGLVPAVAAAPASGGLQDLRPSPGGLSPGARRALKIALSFLPVLLAILWFDGRAPVSVFDRMGLGRPQPVAGVLDARGFQSLLVNPETNEPVRYGCDPVRYVIDPTHAPEGGVDDVHRAIAEVSKAGGIRFVYEGETDERPVEKRPPVQPDRYGRRWAPILVAWELGPSPVAGQTIEIGVGGSEWRYNQDGEPVYVTGMLALNANAGLRSGFGGETWGQVMLHELGHVVGLGHVSDPKQVMTPLLELRPAAWGSGDRAGLRALGIGSPCLDVPPVS
ncbi:MAG: matrixin family metalloprotease [Actinobacteria bacterium]|nr:matrixin family metalloprotease [Actinomycetota bacterium]